MIGRLAALALAWAALVAATPLPLRPPPPDLRAVVPFVAAPLDKPAVEIPRLDLPPAPAEVPEYPPVPRLYLPRAAKPTAPVPPPRTFPPPCLTRFLSAVESLECGLARYARGEYEDAAAAFEQAIRPGTEGWVLIESRYWLGETHYTLGRYQQSDSTLRLVAVEQGHEYSVWAAHSSGWTALRLGDYQRARDTFTRLLSAPRGVPPPADVWARHGLGLALYALGQYADAERQWTSLAGLRLPPVLERDVLFWRGEALGRTGKHQEAAQALSRFTQPADLHPLGWTALARLGWQNLKAGWIPQAIQSFNAFLGAQPTPEAVLIPNEREWVEAGLVLAMLEAGDPEAVRRASQLDARRSPIAAAVRMRLLARSSGTGDAAATEAVAQELLAGDLTPTARAWVLVVKGDAQLAAGNRDEARTQYELARQIDGTSPVGMHALVRTGQVDFEQREYRQALQDVAPLLAPGAAPAPVRAAALVIRGEAAYRAGDYAAAAEAYRTLLAEAPNSPLAPSLRLALAWTALRRNQLDDAFRQFEEFARLYPGDPHAVDALLLASEMALASNSLDRARGLLDRIVAAYQTHPRVEFARLNRALLSLRTGEIEKARGELSDWIARAPFPPLLGRAHAALGIAHLTAGRRTDATQEFERARKEGFTEIATLGLGVVALLEERWDDAARLLNEAKALGPWYAPAAEYGLAVVAFHRGQPADFERRAVDMIDEGPDRPIVPDLLYILIALDAERGQWTDAMVMAQRMIKQFAKHEAADDALERIGAAAAKASAWPVVQQAYGLLHQHFPQSPFVDSSRLVYGRALVQTGRLPEGRQVLEEAVRAAGDDKSAAAAWRDLARAREAAGDRAGAVEAYGRAAQLGGDQGARLEQARLLVASKRWDEARRALEPELRSPEPAPAAEAAVAIAEIYEAQGDHMAAAEYYMTAAYLAPNTTAGQRALLAAGRAFTAVKQPDAAEKVYRKLLAQSGVPADLAEAARRGLAALKR